LNINKQTNFEYDFWAKVKALVYVTAVTLTQPILNGPSDPVCPTYMRLHAKLS